MKLSRCHPFCKYASSLKWDKSWFLQVWNSFTKKFSCLLTPWSRVLLEKLTGSQPVKKFPSFYGTRKFITAFTSDRHLSLSWAISIHSMPPHRTSWRSILILPSHLRLGLPSGLFLSGFPNKTVYSPLLSPIRATKYSTTSNEVRKKRKQFSCSAALRPPRAYAVTLLRLLAHKQLDTLLVGLLWKSDQLVAGATAYTVQETQEENIHALSGIWTHDPNNQAAADLRLGSHGHSTNQFRFSKRA